MQQPFDPLGLGVDLTLDSVGAHKERSGKEEHLYNPLTIHMLQEATRTGNYELFKKYSESLRDDGNPMSLRSLMEFKFLRTEAFRLRRLRVLTAS